MYLSHLYNTIVVYLILSALYVGFDFDFDTPLPYSEHSLYLL